MTALRRKVSNSLCFPCCGHCLCSWYLCQICSLAS